MASSKENKSVKAEVKSSETPKTETSKATEEVVDNSSKIATPVTKANKGVMFGAMALAVTIVLAVIVGAIVILMKNSSNSNVDFDEDNNSLTQLNEAIQNYGSGLVATMSFDGVASDSNPKLIDETKFEELFAQIAENNKDYLGQNQDLAGKTVHEAMDMSFKSESSASGLLSIELDMYSQYGEDYNPEGLSGAKTYAELIQNFNAEYFKSSLPEKMFIEGNLQFSQADYLTRKPQDITVDFEATLDGLDVYFKLIDISGSGTQGMPQEVALLKGKVMKINLEKLLDLYGEVYKTTANQNSSSFNIMPYPTTAEGYVDLVNQYYEQYVNALSEKDKKTLERVGNDIVAELSNMFTNYEPFTDTNEVDPIREAEDVLCVEGDLDLDNLLDVTQDSMENIGKIIINDESYSGGQNLEDFVAEIEKSFADAKKSVAESNFQLAVTLCNDDKAIRGFGADMNFDGGYQGVTSMAIQYLTVDIDSSFSIVVPKADVDYTKDFNQLLEQYMGLLQNPYQYSYPDYSGSSDSEAPSVNPADKLEEATKASECQDKLVALTTEYYEGKISDNDYAAEYQELVGECY